MKQQFAGMHMDFVGFMVSLLCAIHCASLPILLSIAPLMSLGILSNPWIEYSLILLSLLIASYTLISSYRKHHQKPLALITVVGGFILIGMGRFLENEWLEVLFTSLGAVLVALGHLVNWKHVRMAKTTHDH